MKEISRPVFIAGPARSGTSLLFSIVSKARSLWSPYRELHAPYEWGIGLKPDLEKGGSNQLSRKHVTSSRASIVRATLWSESFNIELFGSTHPVGGVYHLVRRTSEVYKRLRRAPIRIVDKNPKHCFRIDFLHEIFPDAKFIFLFRRPETNINSLIEGWESGKFATYKIPHQGEIFRWQFDLPPGWVEWIDRDLPARCAHQWVGYNRALLRAERALPTGSVVRCHYEDLLDNPFLVVRSLFDFLDVEMTGTVQSHCESLPVVNSVTAPDPEKWRKRERMIGETKPIFQDTAVKVGYDLLV